MKNGYLINNCIEFCPHEHRLSAHGDNRLTTILTSPASRCLLLLIEKHPEMVPQDDFFSKVWGEEGMLVPPNTLYQNISLIRRGLKTVNGGVETNLVLTVPRKGFMLADNVNISEFNAETLPGGPDAVMTVTPGMSLPPPHRPAGAVPVLSLPAPDVKVKTAFGYRGRTAFFIAFFLVITLLTGSALTLFTRYEDNRFTDFFRNYELVTQADGCHIYENNNEAPVSVKALKSYANCERYPYVYITSFTGLPTISILTCREDIHKNTGTPDCVSWFFRDGVPKQ